MEQMIYTATGILLSIIGYFLRDTMSQLKEVRTTALETKIKLEILENNHSHLTEKFDSLFDAVKELTGEIKHLSSQLAKKKDM